MSEEARAKLRASQRELVRALVAHGPVPAGWDAQRVEAAAHALAHKRARAAAAAWPSVREVLGEAYFQEFIRYARSHPLPADGGALADGRRFIEYAHENGRLWPDEVQLASARVDLRWRTCADGLRSRRFPTLLVRRLPSGARVVACGPLFGAVFWRVRA